MGGFPYYSVFVGKRQPGSSPGKSPPPLGQGKDLGTVLSDGNCVLKMG